MRITSKAEFFEGVKTLRFGNYPRAWTSVEDALTSDCKTFGIRENGKVGGIVKYHIPADSLEVVSKECGIAEDRLQITEGMPDSRIYLQGDLSKITGIGLFLEYSDMWGLTHREALSSKWKKTAKRLRALTLLRYYAWPKSMTMLEDLMDELDMECTVIEFGIYATAVGQIPGHNMIIWEVRTNY